MTSKKKTHLYVSCHPYKYARYIFCLSDLVEEDDYDKWLVSDKIEEVTCKKCLKYEAKLTKQMLEAGVIDESGKVII